MSWDESSNRFVRNNRIYYRVKTLVLQEKPDTYIGGYSELEEVTRYLFRQVAEGLRYLHEDMRIAHRDIKPDNILYCTQRADGLYTGEIDDKEADRVKIGDFTVALELTREQVRVND
jgi:serine/threonine protein kinase